MEAHADVSYLERIVAKPTWKQILLELVEQERIDPWNVDIISLSDEFMSRVKQMQMLDLGLHASVILAAAILLKYKSEYLKQFTAPPVSELPPGELDQQLDIPEFPQLSIAARIPPKRQITIEELMGEMDRVIKYESAEIRRTPKGAITEMVDLNLNGDDIEKRMELVLSRIKETKDESGFATFSGLLEKRSPLEVVYTLLSVLHLTQSNTVDIYQEKLFGEILICIAEHNGNGKENRKKPKTEKIEEKEIEEKIEVYS